MKVIIFGATGMVGQGVLRECLLNPDINQVLVIGRSSVGQKHQKLRELLVPNVSDLSSIEPELGGYDAAFFCLGVTSAGMPEAEYRKVTYDIPVAVAGTLARINPGMTFIHVSGGGADSSEQGRIMWARVKGAAENALLRLSFKKVYIFRPGIIIPQHGITSRTKWYRIFYAVMKPILPVLKPLLPNYITTTDQLGHAMIAVAKNGFSKPVLGMGDINTIV